jgi:hypothetical protein
MKIRLGPQRGAFAGIHHESNLLSRFPRLTVVPKEERIRRVSARAERLEKSYAFFCQNNVSTSSGLAHCNMKIPTVELDVAHERRGQFSVPTTREESSMYEVAKASRAGIDEPPALGDREIP